MIGAPDQNSLDDEVLAKIKKDHREKSLKMRNLVKKSFIMNDQSEESKRVMKEMDSDLKKYMEAVNKLEKEKKELARASVFSFAYWKFNISRNLELFSTLLIDTNVLLALYPLNTIKTRIQAQHKYEDVAYFIKNRVDQKSVYKGISQGYVSNIIGIATTFTMAKALMMTLEENEQSKKWNEFTKSLLCLTFGEMVASPLRLAFEVKKQTLQICGKPLQISEYLTKMRKSFLPSVFRDALFRFNTGFLFHLFLYHDYYLYKLSEGLQGRNISESYIYKSKITYNDQITSMILSTLVSLAISNPFDVVNTKIVTQQYPKYNGFLDCARTVYREEGYKKLVFSGYWPRSVYHCAQTVVIFNFYGKVKELLGKAFIDD